MKFDNRAPINLDNSEEIASASTDGGAYDGIGYNTYKVYQGKKRLHLTHRYSDGCERNNKVSRTSKYLGSFENEEALTEWLCKNAAGEWWANEILEELGYKGEEA